MFPGIRGKTNFGRLANGNWWVQFNVDIGHKLAWNIVQEFGFVLNDVSMKSRLPTVFKPISPPPYLNAARGNFSPG